MEPNQVEPIRTLPPPPRRSERVFRPPERYLGIISEDIEEMFLIGNGAHGDDPKPTTRRYQISTPRNGLRQ